MMNILVVGPQEVMPPSDGGREGIHGLISALSKTCCVTYAYPTDRFDGTTAEAYSAKGIASVPIIYHVTESWGLVLSSCLALKPYKFSKYSGRKLIGLFESKLRGQSFDAILCCHPHMFSVAEYLKKTNNWECPIILREHNIEYELVRGYIKSLRGLRKLFGWFFYKLTKLEEISIWNRADGVAFLTSTDFVTASNQCNLSTFFVAPEGTPIPHRNFDVTLNRSNTLLILLNKKATQSVSNVCQFLETIWVEAKILPDFPDVSITVTGVTLDELSARSSLSIQELEDLGVSCVGYVDSLDVLFDSSLALISPTYIGGGVRKKILESMANYLPVIASPLDVDSADYLIDKINILKFNSTEDLKRAIILLMSKDYANEISISARTTVEENASWEKCARRISDYLIEMNVKEN